MKFVLLFITLVLFSCSKSTDCLIEDECLDSLLNKYNMVPYSGGEHPCWSLQLVECEKQKYYFIDCCICDMAFNPFDCDNKALLYDENGAYSQEKQKIFDATFVNCKEPIIVGIHK